MKIPQLMLITDGTLHENPKALQYILEACKFSIPAIQLREKMLEGRKLLEYAKQIRKLAPLLLINERTDIALACDADGVHLPEKGVSPEIPKKLNPSFLVGVSVHSLESGLRAQKEGADYVIFGPIFETPSKCALGDPQGLKKLEEIATKLTIPVIAVGGITPSNAKECLQAGAHGIAAISAFSQSKNLKETIHAFEKGIYERTSVYS